MRVIFTALGTLATTHVLAATSAAIHEPSEGHSGSFTCPQHGSTNSSFTNPISTKDLPGVFHGAAGHQDPDDFVQIRNIGMLYPLIIDGKSFASLGDVFATDVVANLGRGPSVSGLGALAGALAASLARVNSHHNLGSQCISIADGGCSAVSITYFHATLLGIGPSYGQIVYALGQYQDSWLKKAVGWRISNRNLIFMSPFIGNSSIVGG